MFEDEQQKDVKKLDLASKLEAGKIELTHSIFGTDQEKTISMSIHPVESEKQQNNRNMSHTMREVRKLDHIDTTDALRVSQVADEYTPQADAIENRMARQASPEFGRGVDSSELKRPAVVFLQRSELSSSEKPSAHKAESVVQSEVRDAGIQVEHPSDTSHVEEEEEEEKEEEKELPL